MAKREVKVGDVVRLYGYPGTFVVGQDAPWRVYGEEGCFVSRADGLGGFATSVRNIVEVNGVPVPLLTAPIAPPAEDYPHEPQFDYDDGPASLGEEALRIWRERRSLS